MPRQTIRSLAEEIRRRWPSLLVEVRKSHASTDRQYGHVRWPGKGRDGTRLIVRDPAQMEPPDWGEKPTNEPRILLDHDNAPAYRRSDEVRRWIDARIAEERRERRKARRA